MSRTRRTRRSRTWPRSPAPPSAPDFAAARTSSRGASPRARELDAALARLKAGGVTRALLVAGDQTPPAGEFASTLEILESGALAAAGIDVDRRRGPPGGQPEHPARPRSGTRSRASRPMARKAGVARARREPVRLRPGGARRLGRASSTARGIALPVHVGVAGPASLKSLAKFAMMCGIGASLGALLSNPAALGEPEEPREDGRRDLPGDRAPARRRARAAPRAAAFLRVRRRA